MSKKSILLTSIFVPAKGLIISGMVMPMLTCFNRMKTYRYNSVIIYSFRFHHDNNRGVLREWFVNTALGFRF